MTSRAVVTKTTAKRKAKPVEDIADGEDDADLYQQKKKKPAKAKKEASNVPHTGSHGWEIEPNLFLLWKCDPFFRHPSINVAVSSMLKHQALLQDLWEAETEQEDSCFRPGKLVSKNS